MIHSAVRVIELTEHRTSRLSAVVLTTAQGASLMRRALKQVDVQFPSPRTDNMWELTSQGYVGVLPVDGDVTVVVRPKVPIGNIAHMLAEVFDLPIRDSSGLVGCSTLEGLYDQLAKLLAERVLQLGRQGFHQAYRERLAPLSAVRGRILFNGLARSAVDARLSCAFRERTGDILEHRIPLVVIDRILRSRICGGPTTQLLREAHRRLSTITVQGPVTIADCDSLRFDRLTERYRPVIALCRLFMQYSGPAARHGEAEAVPFLISMPSLFERYAAIWLGRRCERDGRFGVRAQESSIIGDTANVEFQPDLVVYEIASNTAVCVIDTKYKDASAPSAADVAQVAFYAQLKGTKLACLAYPVGIAGGWQGMSGNVRTYRGTIDLAGDATQSGEAFFQEMLMQINQSASHPESL